MQVPGLAELFSYGLELYMGSAWQCQPFFTPASKRRGHWLHLFSMPRKNLGFLRSGQQVYTLDLIYPTATSPVELSALEAAEEVRLRELHNHTYAAGRTRLDSCPKAGLPPTTLASLCLEPDIHGAPTAWQGCNSKPSSLRASSRGPSPTKIG